MSETYKKITVALSGGCELLFNKETNLSLNSVVPVGTSVSQLVTLLKRDYVKERPELLVDASGANVRPGILVLVNGCDVEVMGGVEHVLEDGDEVEFISTLHGG
ncbi:Ubiquitin related modifier (urm1)-like protein [Leptomonas pyrrhocoris]|uniref:Ubiquitin-related modifier 1 homolog n=1 Tax=Leptomonas pyrrhocoris TaxID=157538 RepID=A0A0N0VFY0_LEPPY|nr:Ubiquitin related modifier (urm1)-like protein [Leptomonas pyrrhocoris]KPA82358.1 Ubiquitin related modifier (urm1)-like protein [Leptomonas pyrrhocoris]|eukprot:XP_015660797.1 Ubiquitin related modifier (urm1)-like protein [Leptomonas pyrrhocoris]